MPQTIPPDDLTRPALGIGDTFRTAGRTITETDVVNFAGLSGDFNRLHVDAEYASSTSFHQRIAHGLLVLSVLSGLTTQSAGYRALEPWILGLLDVSCRFPRPTFIGDTIHVQVTVLERTPTSKPGRCVVVFRREAVNQRDEIVVQADFKMMIREEVAA